MSVSGGSTVIASSSHWSVVLFTFVVIGHCNKNALVLVLVLRHLKNCSIPVSHTTPGGGGGGGAKRNLGGGGSNKKSTDEVTEKYYYLRQNLTTMKQLLNAFFYRHFHLNLSAKIKGKQFKKAPVLNIFQIIFMEGVKH